jgi:fructuronate reductase/mannitol 2-dehydrogenase
MTTWSYRGSPAACSLNHANLPKLRTRIDVPTFDRAVLHPGVVHLGVGAFHRAHQAMYLDDLARSGHTGWGEIGVGLRSPAMRDALLPQDCLFTVVERGADGDTARAVGSMIGYRYAPDDPPAVIQLLADERTRLVTLTITGGGYDIDNDPSGHRTPYTAHGYLVEALDRRRRAGLPAFTVLSCDNLPDNGAAARAAVVGCARLRDAGLAAWIDAEASFPSSMVDRITPSTDDESRRMVAERFGVEDRWPVVTERFSQWIVEDAFCNGRPPLDEVGAQFVTDVTPYKLMKNRLLNAGHSALGYVGGLAGGYRTTGEAMTNPVIVEYLTELMRTEIAPGLPPVPGVDLAAYQRTLLTRFANPRTGDQLSRLCERGSIKMPAYLLPSLMAARRRGHPATLLVLAVAAWICHLSGRGPNGVAIEVTDARRDLLQPLAAVAGSDPRPLLQVRSIFGELGDDPGFVTTLMRSLRNLQAYGAVGTIRQYLAAGVPVAA